MAGQESVQLVEVVEQETVLEFGVKYPWDQMEERAVIQKCGHVVSVKVYRSA